MLKPGDEVEFLDEWPYQPGSLMKVQPGERGRVVGIGTAHCVVDVFGTAVVAPLTTVRRVAVDPPPSGDGDWWRF
jgi:hypothetical protein